MSISPDPVDVAPAAVQAPPASHHSHHHDLPADHPVAPPRHTRTKTDGVDSESDQLDSDDDADHLHHDVTVHSVKRDPSPITPLEPSSPPKTLSPRQLPASAPRVIHPTPPASTSPAPVLMPRETENITPKAPERRASRSERTPALKGKEKENEHEQAEDQSGEKDEQWEDGREPGEYAYEYVPVVQRRKGRENISYDLTVRQQPVHARTCGPGDKTDRRPINPAPIVQLKVMDGDGDDETPSSSTPRDEKRKLRRDSGPKGMMYMQNPYYFLFACLVGEDEEDDELHVIEDGKTRFLSGTPVSSLYHLKDLDGSDAAFFLFPDLGVRKEGKYKLKLTLFEIVDQQVFYCTTTFTQTFTVYTAKQFPGMAKTSELSTSFSDQGLRIWVRKEARRKTKKRKSSANDTDEERAQIISSKRSRGSMPPVFGGDRVQHPPRHQMPTGSPYPPPYPTSAQPSQRPSGYQQGPPTHAAHAYAPPPPSHAHAAHPHPHPHPHAPAQAQGHRMPPPPPPHGAYDGFHAHRPSHQTPPAPFAPHAPYVRPLPTLPPAPPSAYTPHPPEPQDTPHGRGPAPPGANVANYGPPPLAPHDPGPSRPPPRHDAPGVPYPQYPGGPREVPPHAPHDWGRGIAHYNEDSRRHGHSGSAAPSLSRRAAPPRVHEPKTTPPSGYGFGLARDRRDQLPPDGTPYTSAIPPSHHTGGPPRSSGRPDSAPQYDGPARPATGSSHSSALSPLLSLPPPASRPDSRASRDHGPAYSPRMVDHRLDRGPERARSPSSAADFEDRPHHYPPITQPASSHDAHRSVRLPGLADSIPPPLRSAGGSSGSGGHPGSAPRPGPGMTLPPLVEPQYRSAAPAAGPPGPPGTASSTRSIRSSYSDMSGREAESRDGRDGREDRDDLRKGRESREGRGESTKMRGQSVGAVSSASSATTPGGTKSTNRMGLGHLMD